MSDYTPQAGNIFLCAWMFLGIILTGKAECVQPVVCVQFCALLLHGVADSDVKNEIRSGTQFSSQDVSLSFQFGGSKFNTITVHKRQCWVWGGGSPHPVQSPAPKWLLTVV